MSSAHWRHIFGAPVTGGQGKDVPVVWHVSQWDAQIFAALVGFGVPLAGYLLPYNNYVMWAITSFFFACTNLYWYIELRQLIVHYEEFNGLNRQAADHQRSEMQSIYYGLILAGLFYVVPWIIYGLTYWWFNDPRWVGPYYGVPHWLIMVASFLIARYSIKTIYAILSIIQELQSKVLRREQETPPH